MFSGRKELFKWEAEGDNSLLLETRWLLEPRRRRRQSSMQVRPKVSAICSCVSLSESKSMENLICDHSFMGLLYIQNVFCKLRKR